MSGQTSLGMPRCPGCGAPNPPGVAVCSDCGRDIGAHSSGAPIGFPVEGSGIIRKDQRPGRSWSVVTGVVVTAAFGMILVGLYGKHPGLSVLLGVLIGPALMVTYGRALSRRFLAYQTPTGKATGRCGEVSKGPMTGAEKFKTFAVTLSATIAVIVAIVVLLILAAFIALYVFCTQS